MNYLTVKSKNGNHYFISEKDKMVIYIPNKFLSFFADNAISEHNKRPSLLLFPPNSTSLKEKPYFRYRVRER